MKNRLSNLDRTLKLAHTLSESSQGPAMSGCWMILDV